MDAPAIHRQLKIKSGVTKRLLKEHTLYRKEAEEQKRKHDKMVADGAEGWDIRNAAKILDESMRMIKDVDERLGKAVMDLRGLVVQVKNDPKYAKDVELMQAEEILEEASV